MAKDETTLVCLLKHQEILWLNHTEKIEGVDKVKLYLDGNEVCVLMNDRCFLDSFLN